MSITVIKFIITILINFKFDLFLIQYSFLELQVILINNELILHYFT
jgi:hypothetical protein